jgi:hypothetical protein
LAGLIANSGDFQAQRNPGRRLFLKHGMASNLQ